ncbi:hypothetical protein EH196_06895 [Bacillus sp. C1-1]|nr:hypothetical protein EH196_06895 [Bacillus sp. C1-1]
MIVKNPYLDVLIVFVSCFFLTYFIRLLAAFGDHSLSENWHMHLAQAIGLTVGFAIFSALGRKRKNNN